MSKMYGNITVTCDCGMTGHVTRDFKIEAITDSLFDQVRIGLVDRLRWTIPPDGNPKCGRCSYPEEVIYTPNLYRNKANGFVVLFRSPMQFNMIQSGVVVEKGNCECFPIGHVRDDWNRDEFEPLPEGALGRTWEVSK